MKIAHISDLHLNSESNSSAFVQVKSVLKFISRKNFDHLVITGDISDNASSRDFLVLRNLLQRFGFLRWDKLSIVIGNHDIFGGVQTADDLLNFSTKFSSVDYSQKVEEFVSYFRQSMENCFYLSQNGYFPFAKRINDTLLIGVNSNARYSSLTNPFASNGEINAAQFTELVELLKIPQIGIKHRVLLIHHHFHKLKAESQSSLGKIWQNIEKQTMKLKNKKRLFRLFKDYKIDLVLHGHTHQSKEYFRKGIHFVNSGGSFRNNKSNNLYVNSILIDKSGIQVSIEPIEFSLQKNKIDFNRSMKLVKNIGNMQVGYDQKKEASGI